MVHTLVPEKYRFWTSNQQGVSCRPVTICPGPLGSILTLDYDFKTACSRLLKIRIHQPAAGCSRATEWCERIYVSAGDVAYMAELGNACIRFEDLDGKARLNPNSLRPCADLKRTLSDNNLTIDRTVPT